jgi:hypothetical protein
VHRLGGTEAEIEGVLWGIFIERGIKVAHVGRSTAGLHMRDNVVVNGDDRRDDVTFGWRRRYNSWL